MTELKVGTRVRINTPNEKDLHGKEGIIEDYESGQDLPYVVHIPHNKTEHLAGLCGSCDSPSFKVSELIIIPAEEILEDIRKDLKERINNMMKMPYLVSGITCEGIAEIFKYMLKEHFGE